MRDYIFKEILFVPEITVNHHDHRSSLAAALRH